MIGQLRCMLGGLFN